MGNFFSVKSEKNAEKKLSTVLSKAAEKGNFEKKGYAINEKDEKDKKVQTRMKIFVCGKKFPENIYSYITRPHQNNTEQKEQNKVEATDNKVANDEATNGEVTKDEITVDEVTDEKAEKGSRVKKENFKHPNKNLDWDYYFFEEGELGNNRIHEILSVIKSNYIKGEKNNVLIVVSQIDDSNELKSFCDKISQNYSPYSAYIELIFMNYDREEKYFDLYITEDNDDNDDGEVERKKVDEPGEGKILKALFEKCSYFNQLGDSITYYPNLFPRTEEEVIKNIYGNTLNVLVIGDRGSGKSTLINKIIGKKKARTGLNKDITKNITFYFKDRFTFFDVPGSHGLGDESTYIDLIKKNNEGKYNLNNQIHAIFYTIAAQTLRPSYELIINILESFPEIELYILITGIGKNKKTEQDILLNFKEDLEIELKDLIKKKKKACINIENLKDCVFPLELKSKQNGLGGLLDKVYKDFKKYKFEELDEKKLKLKSVDSMIEEIQKPKLFYNVKSFDDLLKLRKYYFELFTNQLGIYYSLEKPKILREQKELFVKIGKCFGLDENKSTKIFNDCQTDENTMTHRKYLFGFIPIPFTYDAEIEYAAKEAEELFENEIKKYNDLKKNKFIYYQMEDFNEVIEGINKLSKQFQEKNKTVSK